MNEIEISVDINKNYKGNDFFFFYEMIMFILKEYDCWRI
jgi:hypothetical protein